MVLEVQQYESSFLRKVKSLSIAVFKSKVKEKIQNFSNNFYYFKFILIQVILLFTTKNKTFCLFLLLIYNHVHYIFKYFDGCKNFPFTTSETKRDYY